MCWAEQAHACLCYNIIMDWVIGLLGQAHVCAMQFIMLVQLRIIMDWVIGLLAWAGTCLCQFIMYHAGTAVDGLGQAYACAS